MKKGCIIVKPNTTQNQIIMTTSSIQFPQSYKSKDEAFEFGQGDNFFILPNGEFICVSENDPIFTKMINAGMKTELQIFLESLK